MSWIDRLWQAHAAGHISREEAWQVMLDAREAPDPGKVVDRVLRGLALAYQPPPEVPEIEPVVIEDLPPAAER
jgi:hypothetical protein